MSRITHAQEVQRIALLLPIDIESGRAVLRGVKSYARPDHPWAFHIALPDPKVVATLKAWKPAGVIAHLDQAKLVNALEKLRSPVVNVCNALETTSFPRVGLNNALVGKLAAEHFLQRGLAHFAFVGHCEHVYVRERRDAFQEALSSATPRSIQVFSAPSPTPWGGNWALTEKRLHRWMLALPKPVGVLTANDQLGLQLAEVCRMIRLRVPDDVSIVGVDNDELVCQLASPPLSSICGCGERTGYAAAEMLDRSMRGEPAPRLPVLLPPAALITRQSSDLLTVSDRDVQTVVRFIRDHATGPLAVNDVLGELHISRRSIERKFRSLLGRTLLDEIRRVRIEHVKRMLSETDCTIAEIAARTGFASPERLTIVYRATVGMVPSVYRARFRQRV